MWISTSPGSTYSPAALRISSPSRGCKSPICAIFPFSTRTSARVKWPPMNAVPFLTSMVYSSSISLPASRSVRITQQGWSCRTDAGTRGVIGPRMVSYTAFALFSPVATSTTHFAAMMLPMPMETA